MCPPLLRCLRSQSELPTNNNTNIHDDDEDGGIDDTLGSTSSSTQHRVFSLSLFLSRCRCCCFEQRLQAHEFFSRLIGVPFRGGFAILDPPVGLPVHKPYPSFYQKVGQGRLLLRRWRSWDVAVVVVVVSEEIRHDRCHRVLGVPDVGSDDARGTTLQPSRHVQRCEAWCIVAFVVVVVILVLVVTLVADVAADEDTAAVVPENPRFVVERRLRGLVDRQAPVADADQAQVGTDALGRSGPGGPLGTGIVSRQLRALAHHGREPGRPVVAGSPGVVARSGLEADRVRQEPEADLGGVPVPPLVFFRFLCGCRCVPPEQLVDAGSRPRLELLPRGLGGCPR
eukprot:CAMPEP_0201253176 /NCGR_PEP_ID=MMETSP0852-20130820/67310_1 /ASSEMBLY_ACC=CAM_ASM_000632 /TAXON_ID=183588 /ORGANISM="Pseudo-nitzschia fraudulenta, Strain WWA7" /LENGTH=339 /DNA_ID=CAMNT_0047552943 /DNA_START=1158 /DNA_END=2174 /DNA_ORIENTATION=-